MGQLVDQDREHLRLLTLGYYIMAGMSAAGSLFTLIYIAIGIVIASGAFPANDQSGSQHDARFIGWIFVSIGSVLLLMGLTTAVLTFLTGRYLRDCKHRTFCLIIAGLSCLQIPWGTAIGICTMMVLLRPSVRAAFENPQVPPPLPKIG